MRPETAVQILKIIIFCSSGRVWDTIIDHVLNYIRDPVLIASSLTHQVINR